MKVLYITYENLYKTAILQAMVVKPLTLMSEKYDIDFTITSSMKSFEKDDIYISNKNNVEQNTNLGVVEFEKNLTPKTSVFTFIKDILPMIKYSIREAKKSDIIHCRSYGGAMIGFIASIFSGKPFIFDMRGVMPEEIVDMGRMSQKSFKYKLMKFAEKVLIKQSAYVLTVSEKFNDYIYKEFNKVNTVNINNPTDFDKYFKVNRKDNKVNFIYSGSMQIWHLPELTIEYFSKIEKKFGEKVYFYFCTNDTGKAEQIFEKFNVPKNSYTINTVPFENMPEYYAQADIAFCLIKESFSKSVCFPVKFSEYIASNLYTIGNRNIGDIDKIIETYKCGIVLEDLTMIDENIEKLSLVIDSILDDSYQNYNRDDLSFLNWKDRGIENIYNVYKKVLEEKNS
jgi:hypothetical protein